MSYPELDQSIPHFPWSTELAEGEPDHRLTALQSATEDPRVKEAAFSCIVEEFGNGLRYYTGTQLGPSKSEDAADDIVQETFISALNSIDRFEPREDSEHPLRNWLLTIASNKVRDYHRKDRRYRTRLSKTPVAALKSREDPSSDPVTKVEFEETLSELRKQNKKIFEALMLNIAGFTYPELSEYYGISSEGVASRAYQGRKAAKLALAELN